MFIYFKTEDICLINDRMRCSTSDMTAYNHRTVL